MRLQHIIQAVFSEPWLIQPETHAVIRELVQTKLIDGSPAEFFARDPGKGLCGEAVAVPEMEVMDNGIALIPVGGVMGRKLSAFERGSGAVDTLDVSAELHEALGLDEVESIVLDIDSPGGMVNGTPELADLVAKVNRTKPVYAFTGGTMASAAYYIAAGAKQIFSTSSANIGSIGVYLPWIDSSGAFYQKGLQVDLIKSGKFKGAGFPGTSLTPEQRAHLQNRVDSIAAKFKDHVQASRQVSDESMQGQVFSASEAFERGLIDGQVSDLQEVLSLVAR